MIHKALVIIVLAAMVLSNVNAVAVWGQCGGIGYSGSTVCDSGSSCVKQNDYYSQCLPSSQAPSTTKAPTSTSNPAPAATGLNAGMVKHGKKYWGTCAAQSDINNSQNQALLKSDFGCLTPGNAMKWDATEPSQGNFKYTEADFIVNWAQSNGKIMRGHTLLWHNQLPTWVQNINDKTTLTNVLKNHIANVAGRYKGKLYAWDVCNEVLNEDGSLRSSVWSKVFGGNGFISVAFQAARAADPTAKLYINDYNLDSNNAKVQGMIGLVNSINSGGKLIDAIGTQMHLGAGGAGGAQAALTALASTGLEVAITELDIAQASSNDYTTVVKACLNTPACIGITTWGVADANSWRYDDVPLLFDRSYKPKPAYYSVLQTLA